MIYGLSEFEKYRVIRPIIGSYELDHYDMPIIRRFSMRRMDLDQLKVLNYKNLSVNRDNSHTLALMFQYDRILLALWNQPLKRIPLFQTCAAVATPDFSLYSTMNPNEIRHNIYQSRWLGCTWQNYGVNVWPTMGWADSSTYDLCFSGVETGCPVVISTLGCQERQQEFLDGFIEMRKRIDPPLIIVYGNMIPGMTGTFIHFNYEDALSKKAEQICMPGLSKVFTIKEVA